MKLITHWINGKTWDGSPERTGTVFDPAQGKAQAKVAFASPNEVDLAVQAAGEAFEEWSESSLAKRAQVMFGFRELIVRHASELARIVSEEHGKTVPDALGEVQRGLEVVEFACGIPHLLKGDFSENVSSGVDTYSIRQPVGICAGVTPFNFPVMVPMWMYPVAIACGNTFVLKPSERDPSASIFSAELLAEAGLPEGVFNVVHGDKVAVDGILDHPDIAAVSFVGSTPIARYIYEQSAKHGKRVQALGGAKNHMVVLPDANMDMAADAAVSAAYGSAGERCMSISVVVAVGDAGDRLIPEIEERIAKLRVGPGSKEGIDMGPLVTESHRDRVAGYIEQGIEEGAELVVDGRGLEVEGHGEGFFLGATLFDRVTPGMKIYQDEIFGPVLSVVRARDYEEAIDLINRNPYGNGTALFTREGAAARKFQKEIRVGMVGVNLPIPVPLSYYSFGGWKESLFGDHAIYGPDGVHFYTRQKVLIGRWPEPIGSGMELHFPQHR
ncbi:MAG: CoA-acylating methylmalonate-semialdehyde dehydrogenase [Actinomycetota bacterium]